MASGGVNYPHPYVASAHASEVQRQVVAEVAVHAKHLATATGVETERLRTAQWQCSGSRQVEQAEIEYTAGSATWGHAQVVQACRIQANRRIGRTFVRHIEANAGAQNAGRASKLPT